MTIAELSAVAVKLPLDFNTVQWIHDNLSEKNQNENCIIKISIYLIDRAVGMVFLENVIINKGNLDSLVLPEKIFVE